MCSQRIQTREFASQILDQKCCRMANLLSMKISRMQQDGWGPDADIRENLTCDGCMDGTAACLCREGDKGVGDFHVPTTNTSLSPCCCYCIPLIHRRAMHHTGTFLSFYIHVAAWKVQRNESCSLLLLRFCNACWALHDTFN